MGPVVLAVVMASIGSVIGQEATISKDLQINEVVRDIDLTTQVVRESLKFELENAGKSSLQYFLFQIDKDSASHLAFIEATVVRKSDSEEKQILKCSKTTAQDTKDADAVYRIDLVKPLGAGQTTKVQVETVYTHMLRPFPTHISQADQQSVVYEGNAHVFSPYLLKTEKTTIKLASSTVESHTKEPQPSKLEGDTITYGPYHNTPANTRSELRVHYENNAAFLRVTRLTRLIEVSHWGNVAVEEFVEMAHAGAQLRGAFSRFDFQRDRRDRMPAVQSFKMLLPASAKDVYYRDEIGNISTSNMRQLNHAVVLDIRPRFPLFGGWRTNYYIGYNVPSYEYLFVNGNNYALKMRFVDHVFDRFVIDDMTLKVILPEGAK